MSAEPPACRPGNKCELDEHTPEFAQIGTPADLPASLEGVPGSSGFWFGTIKRGAPPARPRTSQRSSGARKPEPKSAAAGTLVKEGGC